MRASRRALCSSLSLILLNMGLFLLASQAAAEDDPRKPLGAISRRKDQDALKPYASLVGSWRGVGQIERGRAKGSWSETATWAWSLSQDSAALEIKVQKGKHLKSGKLVPGKLAGDFRFEAVFADGSGCSFQGRGSTPDGSNTKSGAVEPLTLRAEGPLVVGQAQKVRRIVITPLHETRLLMRFESEDPDRAGTVSRLGEVGFTREGVSFAAGESYPRCVVTDGRGTITVSHKGKTYHVCCTGCRDLFNENPEAVIAEFEVRTKASAGK